MGADVERGSAARRPARSGSGGRCHRGGGAARRADRSPGTGALAGRVGRPVAAGARRRGRSGDRPLPAADPGVEPRRRPRGDRDAAGGERRTREGRGCRRPAGCRTDHRAGAPRGDHAGRGGHLPEHRRGVTRHAGTRPSPTDPRSHDAPRAAEPRPGGSARHADQRAGDRGAQPERPHAALATQAHGDPDPAARREHAGAGRGASRPDLAAACGRHGRPAYRADRDRGPRPGRHRRRRTGGAARLGRRGSGSPGGRARRERRPLLPARHPRQGDRSTGARLPRLPHRRRRSRSRHDGRPARRGERPYPRRGVGRRGDEADRPGRRRAPRRPARDHGALARGDGDGVVATVSVPERLLVPLSELPAPRRPVSALVAAAAFRPSSGDESPPSLPASDARVREPKPAAVAAPEFVRPGVPRRVRGAQLPDLGPDRKDGPHVAPDAGRVQGRLHALQAGMSAARVNSIPPLPQQLPGTPSPGAEQDGSPQATPAPASDGDD